MAAKIRAKTTIKPELDLEQLHPHRVQGDRREPQGIGVEDGERAQRGDDDDSDDDDGDDPTSPPMRGRARGLRHVSGGTHGSSLRGRKREEASTARMGRWMPVPGGELLTGGLGTVQPVVLAIRAGRVLRARDGHPLHLGRVGPLPPPPRFRSRTPPPRGRRPGARSVRPSTPGRPSRHARSPRTPRRRRGRPRRPGAGARGPPPPRPAGGPLPTSTSVLGPMAPGIAANETPAAAACSRAGSEAVE